jgi:ribonuclease P protein component
MEETLNPQERIRKKKDFLFIYKKGNRYRGKFFNLIYLSNDLCFSRIAVIASKKIGNAVTRNKAKRWMRALFRKNKKLLKNSLDIIFISKKEILEASWPGLQKDYSAALESIFQKKRAE